MSKRKRINPGSGGREILLPVPVIQHIQSFLGGKQAARTALVSKSWHSAWLTRPNLYFNQAWFDGLRISNHEDFWNLVQKTMIRYEESKLNVIGFTLKLDFFIDAVCPTPEGVCELIKRVRKLCVDGTDFKLIWPSKYFILPTEVLGDERIVRLSLVGVSVRRPEVGEVKFSRLKSIRLEYLSLDDDLFSDTFPCLEDLSIVDCFGYKELEISSSMLKRISIVESGSFRGNLDVPNIQKFVFSGPYFPSLSLAKASKEWEAEISVHHLHHYHRPCTSWFRNMKGLLKRLNASMCKVSLYIRLDDYKCDHGAGQIKRSVEGPPTVENLMLSLPSQFNNYLGLLELLFSFCHPKCITLDWFPSSCLEEKPNNKLIKYLCKILFQDRVDPDFVLSKFFRCMSAVLEADVKIFIDILGDWLSLDWSTLCNGSYVPEKKRRIRFLLRWAIGSSYEVSD